MRSSRKSSDNRRRVLPRSPILLRVLMMKMEFATDGAPGDNFGVWVEGWETGHPALGRSSANRMGEGEMFDCIISDANDDFLSPHSYQLIR